MQTLYVVPARSPRGTVTVAELTDLVAVVVMTPVVVARYVGLHDATEKLIPGVVAVVR